jgi:2'-5' RNA ligase
MPESQLPEKYRLFIALPVPEEVKAEMERAQRQLREAVPEDCARWATCEQFHLTLKFLGYVTSDRVDTLVQSVALAMKAFEPLSLRAQRIGFFSDMRRPRVIWAGVRDEKENLSEIQRAVEAAVRDFTREEAEERFSGHVTLGRTKRMGRREADILSKLATAMAETVFGAWTADRIEIMRSHLSPKGATYTCLASIRLGIPGSA